MMFNLKVRCKRRYQWENEEQKIMKWYVHCHHSWWQCIYFSCQNYTTWAILHPAVIYSGITPQCYLLNSHHMCIICFQVCAWTAMTAWNEYWPCIAPVKHRLSSTKPIRARSEVEFNLLLIVVPADAREEPFLTLWWCYCWLPWLFDTLWHRFC